MTLCNTLESLVEPLRLSDLLHQLLDVRHATRYRPEVPVSVVVRETEEQVPAALRRCSYI